MKLNNQDYIEFDVKDSPARDKTILALGGELKANYCIVNKNKAYLYSGFDDLKIPQCYDVYLKSLNSQLKKHDLYPEIITCDLNPVFLSAQLAQKLKRKKFKKSIIIPVQHHCAHIEAVRAVFKLSNKQLIGIACDGTGLGDNQKVWGCEFFSADKNKLIRAAYLDYIPLPGSDKAVIECWRTAVGLLYMCFGDGLLKLKNKVSWLKEKEYQIRILIQMIEKGVNTPWASSAGRLFDGVSALSGICQKADKQAQAAIALEDQAKKVITCQGKGYKYKIKSIKDKSENKQFSEIFVIDPRLMIKEIVEDISQKVKPEVIAVKFHNSFADMLIDTTLKISKKTKVKDVLFSGGVFLNQILSAKVLSRLEKKGLTVYKPEPLILSDAGLSLGQAMAAVKSAANY